MWSRGCSPARPIRLFLCILNELRQFQDRLEFICCSCSAHFNILGFFFIAYFILIDFVYSVVVMNLFLLETKRVAAESDKPLALCPTG